MPAPRELGFDTLYNSETGPIFMTGIQALVRLPLMQRRHDRARGLSTAGLVTGYRGSPLGAYDQQLWKAKKHLAAHDVIFQPALNEDLAATALWGAQMHRAFGPTRADGVFGVWYGKGAGVDRSGDVLRNANVLGTSPLGGVLAVAGDDHAAQSSMFPHQTDGVFQSVMMPILQPATVSEILSLGMAGLALSRFSGLWVALKTIAEVVESAATFELPTPHPMFDAPEGVVPGHGLNWDPSIAWPSQRAELERRLVEERLPAAIAWARANRLDRAILAPARKRLCVVTVGKAHQDLMQALELTDLGGGKGEAAGIGVYKVAMSWPLDSQSLLDFARGYPEILVVEEKQPIVESQIKSALYNLPADQRPRIVGKTDLAGAPLLAPTLEFSPRQVARALLGQLGMEDRIEAFATSAAGSTTPFPVRRPYFCAGCPHNTSTRAPEGSAVGGGIGCHVMALSEPKLRTTTFSQMGGEGLQWVGAAPFSKTQHAFQNLGDGTYQHSGALAVRAAVAAEANITFKILYNDAVAMTGGQPAEGILDPPRLTRQLAAEGVSDIRLVSDDPDRWTGADLAPGVRVHHRDELDAVQRTLQTTPGVTAIVYEQTCAAEKRRRRKRGAFPDPDRRLFINPRVCEGCGDCSVQSNCIAVEPLETAYGRKRRINQSSCNKDFSCVKGFCPSFVEIDGPVLRKPDADRLKGFEAERFSSLPEPDVGANQACNIYVAGIGGTGVLTLGALLGAAAHLDEKTATVLDFTGLAQKNGAVVSLVRIAPPGASIHAVRIGEQEADLILGADLVVAASVDGQAKIKPGHTRIVLNIDETPTADVVSDRDARLPARAMRAVLATRAGRPPFELRATAMAEGLFGDSVAANTLLLGYAWQKGLLPLRREALAAAIEANGAAVALNLRAFDWGRLAAIDEEEVLRRAGLATVEPQAESLDELAMRRGQDLTLYQDRAYAMRYERLVATARAAVARFGEAGDDFVRAVVENGYRLMAYKDEYEVARLYCEPAFKAALDAQFAATGKVSVYLAPPLLSRTDPATGRPRKRRFGPWVFTAFKVLAALKGLRGAWADPFGWTQERRTERRLVERYFEIVTDLCARLTRGNLQTAVEIASLPSEVRGYGPVKAAALATIPARRDALLARFDAEAPRADARRLEVQPCA